MTGSNHTSPSNTPSDADERRGFLQLLSYLIMASGLAGGYGTLAAMAGRFLYPTAKKEENWQFVATLDQLTIGHSIPFRLPSGAKVVVARQQDGDTVDSFAALSSVCPHLGCAVHWEAQNNRFFCPCHNGVFNPSGTATEGPPAAAKQSLTKYPLKVEKGLLYIGVSGDTLTQTREA